MAQKLRLNNKENQNEIAFKKLHEFVDQITNEYNVTRQTLRNWILKNKYPKKVDEIKAKKVKLLKKLIEQGLSTDELAKKTKLPKTKIYNYIHTVRLKKSPRLSRVLHYKIWEELDSLGEKKHYLQLAKKYGVKTSRIYYIDLKREDILNRWSKEDSYIKGIEELNKGKMIKYVVKELDLNYSSFMNFIKNYCDINSEGKYFTKINE